MKETSIHIQNLHKRYSINDAYAVEDISLDILAGEFFGILGPNGAGKTSLISMLCGLIKPSSGSFRIFDFNYENHSKEIKQNIGIVPQEYALYPSLTAKQNLMFFASMYGLKGQKANDKIELNLEKLGLLKFINKRIDTFSGGMKRRINLIIGALHSPRILFLDEPTVGADIHSRKEIISYLKELNSQGTTIVYTSHHLLEAQELCSRIAIIDNGKILKLGSSSSLIESVENAKNLEDVFISVTGKNLRDYV